MARLEIHALLEALVTRVTRFRLDGAERLYNNNLRGLRRLDVTISVMS